MVGNNNIVTTFQLFGRRLLRMATNAEPGKDLAAIDAAFRERFA
jgi:hypothetical protein